MLSILASALATIASSSPGYSCDIVGDHGERLAASDIRRDNRLVRMVLDGRPAAFAADETLEIWD